MNENDLNIRGNHSLMKNINRRLIIDLMLQNDAMTKKCIAEKTKLSIPSVTKNMLDLIDEKLIIEEAQEDTAKGRKPSTYRINSRIGLIVGVDLGKANVDIVIGDLYMHVIDNDTYSISPVSDGYKIIHDIIMRIFKLLSKNDILLSNVGRIILANPGIVDSLTGKIRYYAPIAEKWANIAIKDEFEQNLGVETDVLNDVNMAALSIMKPNTSYSTRNYIYIRAYAGMGAGIVIDGKLRNGINGSAGEFGYDAMWDVESQIMLVKYEELISTQYLFQKLTQQLPLNRDSMLFSLVNGDISNLKIEHVLASLQSDKFVQIAVANIAQYFAMVVLNTTMMLDIDTVFLDGDLFRLGDYFIKTMTEIINEYKLNRLAIHVQPVDNQSTVDGCIFYGGRKVIDSYLSNGST